jgi:hypothetical protein
MEAKEKAMILFSKRLELEKEYYKWCIANKVADRPQSVICFLMHKYDFYEKEELFMDKRSKNEN